MSIQMVPPKGPLGSKGCPPRALLGPQGPFGGSYTVVLSCSPLPSRSDAGHGTPTTDARTRATRNTRLARRPKRCPTFPEGCMDKKERPPGTRLARRPKRGGHPPRVSHWPRWSAPLDPLPCITPLRPITNQSNKFKAPQLSSAAHELLTFQCSALLVVVVFVNSKLLRLPEMA